MTRRRLTPAVRAPLVAALVLATSAPVLGAPRVYVRAAAAYEAAGDTTVEDLDCASTDPPALFGCVSGADGRALGARGDFGESAAFEIAGGVELGRRTRLELALAGRPDLDLDAEANFLGVEGEQPVRADAESLSALLLVTLDLGRRDWRLQPFVAAGAGLARNEIDEVTYAFPGLGPQAVTVVRGGEHDDFAWTAAAGASYRLAESAFLELAVRYTDLGEVRTDAGEATIVRSRGPVTLDVAGTRADLETTGVTLGLRYRL